MSNPIPMIKFAGGASYPLEALPLDLRRRWDQAQCRLSHARTRAERRLAHDELEKCAGDAAMAFAPLFALKASPRRSLLGLGLSGR